MTSAAYRGQWTIDELLLHPREAMRFCDEVRRKHGFYDLPDDIILRVILNRRKRPAASRPCRVHGTIKTTPAVEAGLTDRVWSVKDLLYRLASLV